MVRPVEPTAPMICPRFTSWPTTISISLRWPYLVVIPFPWSSRMAFPYPASGPAERTIPSAEAITSVPVGAAMSIPEWNAPSPFNGSIRSPKPALTAPWTGQIDGTLERSETANKLGEIVFEEPLKAVIFRRLKA